MVEVLVGGEQGLFDVAARQAGRVLGLYHWGTTADAVMMGGIVMSASHASASSRNSATKVVDVGIDLQA